MRTRARPALFAVLAVGVLLARPAPASSSAGNASLKAALHVEPHQTRTCAKNMPSLAGRSDLVRTWDTYSDVDVFFVVFSYDSLTGVEFGLEWPQDWGTGFTCHCGDLAAGGISRPGDAMTLTWETCQSNGSRPACWPIAWTWLSPSSDGEVEISPYSLVVTDCAFAEAEPDSIFNAGLNVDPYEGPPGGGVAVEPTTWGALKAMFR